MPVCTMIISEWLGTTFNAVLSHSRILGSLLVHLTMNYISLIISNTLWHLLWLSLESTHPQAALEVTSYGVSTSSGPFNGIQDRTAFLTASITVIAQGIIIRFHFNDRWIVMGHIPSTTWAFKMMLHLLLSLWIFFFDKQGQTLCTQTR